MAAPESADSPLLAAGGRLRIVPLLHGRLEFAVEVRRAFGEHRPTHVAVELPAGLEGPMREAVRRLPQLSVLLIETAGADEATGAPLYALVEPTDGIVEALRLADAHDLPAVFVDRSAARVEPVRQAFPDPHAIESIGLEAYAGPCLAAAAASSTADAAADADDTDLRERTMAFHLSEILADESARVLFVCGLSHAPGVVGVRDPRILLDDREDLPVEMVEVGGAHDSCP